VEGREREMGEVKRAKVAREAAMLARTQLQVTLSTLTRKRDGLGRQGPPCWRGTSGSVHCSGREFAKHFAKVLRKIGWMIKV
jgi:hypothetical protein